MCECDKMFDRVDPLKSNPNSSKECKKFVPAPGLVTRAQLGTEEWRNQFVAKMKEDKDPVCTENEDQQSPTKFDGINLSRYFR
jgi:hypothetical protein